VEKYKNLSRDSGVSQYEIGSDYIDVKFNGKSTIYKYSYSVTGRHHVEIMKTKAISGIGLCRYISENPDVKNRFRKR
jgi:hypothetical protein